MDAKGDFVVSCGHDPRTVLRRLLSSRGGRQQLDRRCDPPGELIRTFVKGCGGDWEHARRRLSAAHGDIARAIVALKRTPQRAQVGQPASPNDPAAVRDYRARQRGG